MDEVLRGKLGESKAKIEALDNAAVEEYLTEYVKLCNPDSIWVCDNSPEDIKHIRERAVELGEETRLDMEGHTYHFENINDQGRDKANTRYLLPEGMDLGELNSIDKKEGLAEVKGFLKDSMVGKEMIVLFFTLGPEDSVFSLPCMQLTDSYYVAHSESILYRGGYKMFRDKEPKKFFRFVHSAGELEGAVSKNLDKRRMYIDLEDNMVFSTNTQYGGNTIGLKKLAMRLAIQKACEEGWLTEHMFIMGVHGSEGITYFTGAFPSACGKTSTSMVEGETIVGDDIAYLHVIDGKVMAANVEKGIFGIIKDVNTKDDPIIYKALTTPREVIFSNVLIKEGKPYWQGMGQELPTEGLNYSGQWTKGKKDSKDKEIMPSHNNARYTIAISELDNRDDKADDPRGVEVGGFIYGGRDSDTSVPVEEAFDYPHGILTKGAALESETTAATLGQEGVRKFNLMSNLDFVSVPLGKYVQCNLDFGAKSKKPPKVFSANYFIKGKDGKYLTGMDDKRVWLKWMYERVHDKVEAIRTPTGYIPKYDDLKRLFKSVLDQEYTKEQYNEQFKVRVLEHLAKIDRIEQIYAKRVPDTPEALTKALDAQRERLLKAREEHGDYILPEKLA